MLYYSFLEDLMPAANMLQLDSIKNSCVEFLQSKLNPSNCLGIRQFADLYDAKELLRSSEECIKKYFPYDIFHLIF